MSLLQLSHAFLQPRISRSCSPATVLQAASSLLHFSCWAASARQVGLWAWCHRPVWHPRHSLSTGATPQGVSKLPSNLPQEPTPVGDTLLAQAVRS